VGGGGLSQGWAGLSVLAIAGCAQLPAVGAGGIPPIAPREARIWVYRDQQPSLIPEVPYVRFNGAIVGVAYAGGAFYRDVLPGAYHVTVDSMGKDVDQSSDVRLAPGQEAFIAIQQLDSWYMAGAWPTAIRPTFYARLMAPGLGQAEVARSANYGGG
jgi:hypothetical protein